MTKVLVIDDNLGMRLMMVDLLSLQGYDVVSSPNGSKGIELARRHIPDLVICDLAMPKVSGHKVLDVLRRSPRTRHIPVIFITASIPRVMEHQSRSMGADALLTKPCDSSELLSTVDRLLKHRQAQGVGAEV